MNFGDLLARLTADPITSNVILLVAILPIVDLVTGVLKAISTGTFDIALIDVWVRTQIAGRVLPIILVLLTGQVVGNITVGSFSFNVVTLAAMTAAVTFIAACAASIIQNLNPQAPDPLPVE